MRFVSRFNICFDSIILTQKILFHINSNITFNLYTLALSQLFCTPDVT